MTGDPRPPVQSSDAHPDGDRSALVVRRASARSPMARHTQRVRHPCLRSHAAADSRRDRPALLPALDAPVPDGGAGGGGRQLAGVGPYTAAAVAAFAYGVDEIALDGNLRRVFARLMDLPVDPRTPQGEARLLRYARRHLPHGKASAFNQSLMD